MHHFSMRRSFIPAKFEEFQPWRGLSNALLMARIKRIPPLVSVLSIAPLNDLTFDPIKGSPPLLNQDGELLMLKNEIGLILAIFE